MLYCLTRISINIMREFKKYAPNQIAKYVLSFFKGKFSIQDHGIFEFYDGKVVVLVSMDENCIKICKEINNAAKAMSNRVQVEQY